MSKKTKVRGKLKGSGEAAKQLAKPKPLKRLVRKNIRKPEDTNETHTDVQNALAKARGSSALKGTLGLSRDSIVVAEKVYRTARW
jgi:hypothetical protein